MDVLNMTRAEIHKFYKKNRILATILKFGDLLGRWKLATNAKNSQYLQNYASQAKKHMDMGCEYHYSNYISVCVNVKPRILYYISYSLSLEAYKLFSKYMNYLLR